MFKFERLEIWNQALAYIDEVYAVSSALPKDEEYNLKSQIRRAATSISLNIAEGSTGQSDAEQSRFLGMALRSLVETVACIQLLRRRRYIRDETKLNKLYEDASLLARRIQSMRRSMQGQGERVREEQEDYQLELEDRIVDDRP